MFRHDSAENGISNIELAYAFSLTNMPPELVPEKTTNHELTLGEIRAEAAGGKFKRAALFAKGLVVRLHASVGWQSAKTEAIGWLVDPTYWQPIITQP